MDTFKLLERELELFQAVSYQYLNRVIISNFVCQSLKLIISSIDGHLLRQAVQQLLITAGMIPMMMGRQDLSDFQVEFLALVINLSST